MQWSLNLSPAQEEDQTPKPIKWLTLKLDTQDIGQLQDHAAVLCLFIEEDKNDYNISVLGCKVSCV